MFITDNDLQNAIVDALKKLRADADIAAHITNNASAANTRAYNEIQRRLISIGYSQAQINGWDHGAEFERDLGLYFAFVDESLNAGDAYDTFIKLKDRRDELSMLSVLIVAGAVVRRNTPTAQVGYGSLDTSQDTFVRNPNDCRRGRVTRW